MVGFTKTFDQNHEARVDQFLLENVQNEIFETFKMFKNSSWMISKISNTENSVTIWSKLNLTV